MANYTDKLDQLWGIPELEAQQRAAIALIKAYLQEVTTASKQLRKMQLNIGGMGDMASMKANAKQIEALTNQQIKSVKALADAKLKEARAEEALSRARLNAARLQANQDKENLALQKELERQAKVNTKALTDFAKQQERAAVNAAKESNAYEQLKRRYKEAADEAKRLGASLTVNSAQFKEAAARAHGLYTELLQIEMAVGQAQRQVGNYNIVGMQFQQLLRELPNAGISARTFVMAISNNVSYFAEAVADSIRQGNSWKSVLKTMGGSLFSVVGIINIALTALTFFTTAITKNKQEAKTAAEAYDDLANSLRKYTDATLASSRQIRRVVGTAAEDARRELELLQAKGAGEKEVYEARKRYNAALKKDAATEINILNDIVQSVNELSGEYNNAKNILADGETQQDVYKRVFVTPLARVLQERLNLSEKQAREEAERLGKNPEVIAELTRQKDDALQVYKDAENAQLISDAEFQKDLTEQQKQALRDRMQQLRDLEKERGAPALMPTLDEINKQIKEYENAGLSNRLQTALFGSEQDEKYALKVLEEQFAQGLISAEDYEMQKLKIHNDFAAQRIQLEIDTTKKLLANGGMLEEDRLKAISRLNDLELELAQQGNDAKLKAEQEAAKASKKIEEERAKEIQRIREELTRAALSSIKLIIDAQNKSSDNYIGRLEREKQEVQNNEERERQRAERTITDVEQREQAILAIEARTDDERRRIEARIAAEQRKKAQRDRDLALFNVLSNLIVGISKEIATKGVAGLATSAAIGLYTTTLTSALAALTIPAYADGTDSHKGGLALVGDGGEPELINTPGGQSFLSPATDTIMNLPKGTEVIPMHKLQPGDIDKLDARAMNTIMLQAGGDSKETERLLHELISEVKRGNSKPSESSHQKDGLTYRSQQKGWDRYNYLRKGFYE